MKRIFTLGEVLIKEKKESELKKIGEQKEKLKTVLDSRIKEETLKNDFIENTWTQCYKKNEQFFLKAFKENLQNIKRNKMIRFILFIELMLTLNSVNGQTKNFIDQPFIETISKVDTLVSPDRIYLSILISERDTKGKKTVEELEQAMVHKLNEVGIDLNKQLFLSDLSSNFKKYFLRKQNILKTKTFKLLVYKAETAGRIIYEMEGIGLSNVDLERIEFSKIEALKLELKTKAVLKAKKQAATMIKPLNRSIGKAIFVSDRRTNVGNMLQREVSGVRIRGYSSRKQKYVAIPIEFEKIKIESEVQVKFIIE